MNNDELNIKEAAAKIMEAVRNPPETHEDAIEVIRSIGKSFDMSEEEIFDSDMPGDLFSKENRLPKE